MTDTDIPPRDARVLALALKILEAGRSPSRDELLDLLEWSTDEILDMLAHQAWQPIETVPNDAYVLLAFEHLPYPVVGINDSWSYRSGGFKATHWKPAPRLPLSYTRTAPP